MASLPAVQPTGATDITAMLRQLGMIEPESEQSFFRVKINGPTFELDDELYPSNQKTKAPAFIGRILESPTLYQGVYLTADEADTVGRPDAADRYCKSHLNAAIYPNEAGVHAEDGTDCHKCPINPYIKKTESPLENFKKCSRRGDLLFNVCDLEGNTIDPRPWILSLASTGMIEFQGMRKEPEKGHVTDLNFMHRLAALGVSLYCDDMEDMVKMQSAVAKAALALPMGGVIAEFRIVMAKSGDGSRNYPVPTLNPVAIVEGAQPHSQLPAGKPASKNVTPDDTKGDLPPETDGDDLPF